MTLRPFPGRGAVTLRPFGSHRGQVPFPGHVEPLRRPYADHDTATLPGRAAARWRSPATWGRCVVPTRTPPGPTRDDSPGSPLSVQVVPEDLGAAGVAELGHGLGLDLADPLAGDAVHLPNLVEGARLAVGEAEAQPDDAGLPLGEGL